MILVLHSQEHPELAHAEAKALFPKAEPRGPCSLIPRAPKALLGRLAYARFAVELLWEGSIQSFDGEGLPDFSKRIGRGSYRVKVYAAEKRLIEGKRIIRRIASSCGRKKVDLENPKNVLWCIITDGRISIGLQVWAQTTSFESRKNHLRTAQAPISLHPRLACAMVNLTGAKGKALIVDPLCGTGGILIEAGLMGLRIHGADIDEAMVASARKNVGSFGLRCTFQQADFLSRRRPCRFLVTDPPYGKNTRLPSSTAEFYAKFIERLAMIVKIRAVVSFPHWYDPADSFQGHGFAVRGTFPVYIHRSLTKMVYVVEKKQP